MTTEQTAEEEKNINLCKEYMAIAYSPSENRGGDSVAHLCHPDSWFWAPATFPGCETPMDYATSHSVVMSAVSDLHIMRFDQVFAKNGHVLLRYTAEGSHVGKPYKGIQATGRHARWSAAAIFDVEDGKIRSFTKDWDQKTMQVCATTQRSWTHCRWEGNIEARTDLRQTDPAGLGAGQRER